MKIRLDPLDVLFSEYIRRRSGGYCERCGKYHSWKGLQTSHFIGRAKKSVRWDEENAVALCFGCHQYFGSQPLEHTRWFEARLGDKFELLQGRARITHPKPDKELLTLYFTQKIGEVKVATAGENVVLNEICYLKSDSKYWKTDADKELL